MSMQSVLFVLIGSAAAAALNLQAVPRAHVVACTGVKVNIKKPDVGVLEEKRAQERAERLEQVRAQVAPFVPAVTAKLADGVSLPASAEALQEALAKDDIAVIYRRMYETQIDMMLEYEEVDGKVNALPPGANSADDKSTKLIMQSLYKYGADMFMQGIFEKKTLEEIVLQKMATRIGMGDDLEKFGEWLSTNDDAEDEQ